MSGHITHVAIDYMHSYVYVAMSLNENTGINSIGG